MHAVRISLVSTMCVHVLLWPAMALGQTVRSTEVRQALEVLSRAEQVVPQRAAAPSANSVRVWAVARSLKAPGGALEIPCRQWVGGSCVETAMSQFFRELDAQRERRAPRPTVVSVLGNSLIASDHITDVIRERLTERFGDGGRGFVLIDRMAPYGRRTRTGEAEPGLSPRTLAQVNRPPPPYPFSMAGVLHLTHQATRSEFLLRDETEAVLHWLEHPRSGRISVRVDGAEQEIWPAHGRSSAAMRQRLSPISIPPQAQKLEVEATPGAVLYGLSLQRRGPGVVLDTLGVPSVDASLFLSAPEPIFREAFAERDPKLVAFVLGGNEIKRVAWGKSTLAKVERGLSELLARTRRAAPHSSCLVIGPIDSVKGGSRKGQGFRQRPELHVVNALQRKVALAGGCAYFDLYRAMGGAGSLRRMHDQQLLHDDLVHPRSGGLDVLGELVARALFRAYEAEPVVADAAAVEQAWRSLAGWEGAPSVPFGSPWLIGGDGPLAHSLHRQLSRQLGERAVSRWSLDGRRPPALQLKKARLVVYVLEHLSQANAQPVRRLLQQLAQRAPAAQLVVVAPLHARQEEVAAKLLAGSRWSLLSSRQALGLSPDDEPLPHGGHARQVVSTVLLSTLLSRRP